MRDDFKVESRWHDLRLAAPWRVGRKVGRTLYAMVGAEPSDGDVLIGVLDSPELAAEAAVAHNYYRDAAL